MNQDDRIDELLNDLDTALSVEPSPAVAAKVRARIANEPARGWLTWHWAGFVGQTFRSAGYAAVLVLAVAAAYLMWPRETPAPEVPQLVSAIEPAGPIATPPVPDRAPTMSVAPSVTTPRTTTALPMAVAREPEVLISPGIRLALAQFDALTRGSVAVGEPQSGIPETIEPSVLAIDVVKIEPPGQTSSGGGTVRK